MSLQQPKHRLGWIDYSRGIAIILVVYRHAFEGLKHTAALAEQGINVSQDYFFLEQANIFLYGFRMPLFFMASGFFLASSLAKRGLTALATAKVRTILYPYFLWGFLQITIQMIFAGFTNGQKSFSSFLYLFYAPRNLEQFWYLLALFNVTVLYAFVKARLRWSAWAQIGFGAALFFLSAAISQYKVELGFVSDVLHYYVFMAIGDAVGNYMLSKESESKWGAGKTVLLLVIPFLLCQMYFLQTNLQHVAQSPKYTYVEYYQPLPYLLVALAGALFIFSLAMWLNRHNRFEWLRNLGHHSLHIYVMHVICFASVRVFMMRVLHIYNVPLLLFCCVAGGVLLPVLFYRLVQNSFLKYLFALPEPQQSTPQQPLRKQPILYGQAVK